MPNMENTERLLALVRLCHCASRAAADRLDGKRPGANGARALLCLERALRYLRAHEPETASWEKRDA